MVIKEEKCKICRRLGMKLFLKGERCYSPKCSFIRRPYPPGNKGKRRSGPLSEFGRQLKEKQKLKNWYGITERQLKNYVRKALDLAKKGKNASEALVNILESRLDNVVYLLGWASSRSQARQLVSHGYFLVNGKPVNIPSYLTKKGDLIKVKPTKIKKGVFEGLLPRLKNHNLPSWLELDIKNFEGKIIGEPSLKEVSLPVEISVIFEYFSR